MKIRDRLTFLYAFSTAVALLALGLAIYFFFSRFRTLEFFDRLNERVEITEKLFLEEKNLEPELYQRIRQQFLQTLPQETEEVYPMNNRPDSVEQALKSIYPDYFIEQLFKEQYAVYEEQQLQGSGKQYQVDGQDYIVIVTAVDTYGIQKLRDLREILLFAFPFSILMIVMIGRYGARKAFQPVIDKIDQVNSISATNLHKRLDIPNPNDEIGQLGITFNQMLDRLETSFEMQKNFISNASHELKNPLTTIIGEAELCLAKDRKKSEYVHALQTISQEADRLNTLINNLLSLAKTDFSKTELMRSTLRLDEVLMEAIQQVRSKYEGRQLNFAAETLPEDYCSLEMKGNHNLLLIAFSNILDNACKFSGDKPVDIWVEHDEGTTKLFVRDYGVGIPKTDRKHILQPFYRSKNARQFKGFGIGLSLTDKIIRLHGGHLSLKSSEGKGTTVQLALPN